MPATMPNENEHTARVRDQALQQQLVAELAADPRLRSSAIDVHVENGRVMLTGSVDSYMKRWAADQTAYRVDGVRSVANEIEVRLPVSSQRTDVEIAAAAAIALESNAALDARQLRVSVEDGVVTLLGSVRWHFERDEAERVIRNLWGVRGVKNLVDVGARTILAQLKNEIVRALARTVESEGTRIDVEANHGKVTLRGKARTWADRAAAERVAWSASGVTAVDNEVVVDAEQGSEAFARR